jgi:hypothetical protein
MNSNFHRVVPGGWQEAHVLGQRHEKPCELELDLSRSTLRRVGPEQQPASLLLCWEGERGQQEA